MSHEELIEQLRARANIAHLAYYTNLGDHAALDREAADALASLSARVAELEGEREAAKREMLAAHAVISVQKRKLDALVNGDKSDVAHAYQLKVNAAEARAAALAADKERLREALTKIVTAQDAALAGRPAYEAITGWRGSNDNPGQIYAWVARAALEKGE